MFTFNHQAAKAEDKYCRRVLRDQNQKSLRVATLLFASAMMLAACGVAPDARTSDSDVVAAVPDSGPNLGAAASVVETANSSLGAFAGPNHMPNYGLLFELLHEDYGVFTGPSWEPNLAALDEALGLDRGPNVVRGDEPWGTPNYGRLETVLGTGSGPQSGPR